MAYPTQLQTAAMLRSHHEAELIADLAECRSNTGTVRAACRRRVLHEVAACRRFRAEYQAAWERMIAARVPMLIAAE